MDVIDTGIGERLVPYDEALALQRSLHGEVAGGTRADTVVLVEHESVYTAGKRTAAWDRPVDGTPVVDVDRGGRITWHGPGQLVAYPIVRLAEPVDVVAYVRALEDAVIAVCRRFGVTAERVDGRSGVWVRPAEGQDRKVCAIGVRVARGVTMHGIGFNVAPDLSAFDRIVPCGIADAGVTSLAQETGAAPTLREVADAFIECLDGPLERLRWETTTTAKESA